MKITAVNSLLNTDFLPLRKVYGEKINAAVVCLRGIKMRQSDGNGNFIDVVPVSQLTAFALEKLYFQKCAFNLGKAVNEQ